jgi:hypothetical protein
MTGFVERPAAIVGVVVVAVIAIAASVFIFSTNRSSGDVELVQPIISSSPNPVPEPAATEADSGAGSDDDSHEGSLDFDRQESAASAAMTAFLTFDTDENVDERLARLQKDFSDPDEVSGLVPNVLADGHEGFKDYSAVLTVNTIDGVAWLVQPTATSDTFIVFVSYTLTETMPGQDRVTHDRGEWQVTFERNEPDVVTILMQ